MSRVAKLAQRARGKYLKPEIPDGPFVIEDANGNQSGVHFPADLQPSGLPGEPWGIFGYGSPRVYRVKSQKKNVMTCEDGIYSIYPAPAINLDRL